jgi:hypothetical protein
LGLPKVLKNTNALAQIGRKILFIAKTNHLDWARLDKAIKRFGRKAGNSFKKNQLIFKNAAAFNLISFL